MICTFEAAMGLHPLWLYLFQKIGARNIGEIETVSHAVQFVQLDQHQVDIGLHNRRDLHHIVSLPQQIEQSVIVNPHMGGKGIGLVFQLITHIKKSKLLERYSTLGLIPMKGIVTDLVTTYHLRRDVVHI